MHSRIQLSNPTVKALYSRLQHAYRQDNVRLVRRLTVLSDLRIHHISVEALAQRWGLSSSCIDGWRQAFMLQGMESLVYRHGGGRQVTLTPARGNAWWP